MTKPIKKVTNCEFCDRQISFESPPDNVRYESGEIHITDGLLFLPRAVIDRNKSDGKGEACATYLQGIYCTPRCLLGQIEKLLYLPKTIAESPVEIGASVFADWLEEQGECQAAIKLKQEFCK